jgi:wobble nucleotide-excising tRNase
MIKKIVEIKNLGVFKNYRCNASVPEFGRFNVIYGWNGSGKTTLSQLFSAFESGKLDEFAELKYKIEADNDEYTQGAPYRKQIRVFNQQYISDNIDVVGGKANPIFILGEENKKLAEAIEEDQLVLLGDPTDPDDVGKIKELDEKQKEHSRLEKERGQHFTSIARSIGSSIEGVTTRTYNKRHAENDFSQLRSKKLLPDNEYEKHKTTLREQEMKLVDTIEGDHIRGLSVKLLADAERLLKDTVETTVIEDLRDNPEIATWTEEGYKLHQQTNSQNCEFCGQPMPGGRIEQLAAHFTDADKRIKDDVDNVLAETDSLRADLRNVKLPDAANFYTEFQDHYEGLKDVFVKARRDLIKTTFEFKQEVEGKKLHTTEALNLTKRFSIASAIKAIDEINELINQHNKKSKSFSDAKEKAAEKIRVHLLSSIYDDIQDLDSQISQTRKDIDVLENGDLNYPSDEGIMLLQERVQENKKKISQSGVACDEINNQLEIFLGRRELEFDVEDDRYILKRGGKIAKSLSEGEKTAIAFVHFTISLKDQDFNAENGIVVVDDPVSSLDSNSLYQAFSFLKNAVQDAYQVFLFTHNFDFLKLLLNWLRRQSGKKYFMIKNQMENGDRCAKLDVLDKLLQNYEIEYQYLFKMLFEFNSDFGSDKTLSAVYNIPNIARKVLEYFLLLMIPDNRNLYKKLQAIDFNENKKIAIYKFTNDQSHITGKGFDPSLVPEAQKNVSYLLEMIEKVFPTHYEALKRNVVGDTSQ